jgi:hypothetical protein
MSMDFRLLMGLSGYICFALKWGIGRSGPCMLMLLFFQTEFIHANTSHP